MKFIGLENWINLIVDDVFWKAFRNNILLAIASIGIEIPVGLFLAYILMIEPIKGKIFFRTAYFNPMIFIPAAIALLWKLIYFPVGGPLNNLLLQLGLPKIDWLGDPNINVWSVILVVVWQWTGWYFVLSLAGMSAIPLEVIESAIIDGASRFRLLTKIIIPLMKSNLFLQITLATTGSLMYFDLFWIMVEGGGPGHSAEVLATWLYKQTFMWSKVGYSCAMATFLTLITFLIGFYWIRQVARAS
ncbi:MAG: sugar ABC transporter permease [Candidatus Korarchaeota archaeon]|nr:sugar ABC transporter permease [Thermoproteota archaeon]